MPATTAGPAASGPFLSFDAGPLQARIYQNGGQVELAGPDLAGTPLANLVTFAAPAVKVAGQSLSLGRVLSSTSLANGLEVVQELGAMTVRARLTFAHDGVMRYEVVDWGGAVVEQSSVTKLARRLTVGFVS
jgi:hypothetical protein